MTMLHLETGINEHLFSDIDTLEAYGSSFMKEVEEKEYIDKIEKEIKLEEEAEN